MDTIKNYNIERYVNGEINEIAECVITEYLYKIYVNNEEFITLICTPKSLKHLALGFLHSEGIISSSEDISSINLYEDEGFVSIELIERAKILNQNQNKRIVTTGCGKGSIYYDAINKVQKSTNINSEVIDYELVIKLMNEFNNKSELFMKTGGVHSVALSDFKDIIFFEEDIGRHNALDKIIGRCLENKVNISNKVILTSGRITTEIILKCAKLNINYIISRSAATDLAINLANELGIRVIGFVRGNKMNIYSK